MSTNIEIKQAFVEGFMERLAVRGMFPSDLEKAAGGFLDLIKSLGTGVGGIGKAIGGTLSGAGSLLGPAGGELMKGILGAGKTLGTVALLTPPAIGAGLGYLSAGGDVTNQGDVDAMQEEQVADAYTKAISELKRRIEQEKLHAKPRPR